LTSSEHHIAPSGIHIDKIFTELGYKTRLDILAALSKNNVKLSALSKDLQFEMPEMHRNMARLQETKLVKRDSEGVFSLTTIGKAVMNQISTFHFLSSYATYLDEHTFGDLPVRFVQSLGALEGCDFLDANISGIETIYLAWTNIIRNSEKYLCVMTPYTTALITEVMFSHIREKGVKLRYILPENAMICKEDIELVKKYAFNELLAKKTAERRMTKTVEVSIIFNENEVLVSFPNEKGETDFTKAFYGIHKNLHEWASDYFHYRWSDSDLFAESKLRRLT
jgi:predicted transcriptional regulator